MKATRMFTDDEVRSAVANVSILYQQLRPGARERCNNAHDALQAFLAVAYNLAQEHAAKTFDDEEKEAAAADKKHSKK